MPGKSQSDRHDLPLARRNIRHDQNHRLRHGPESDRPRRDFYHKRNPVVRVHHAEHRRDRHERLDRSVDRRSRPVSQADVACRRCHRRHHRQPLFMAAHHFHRHAAEQGGSAMVRRRHDVEHARDRHRRKSVLRRSGKQIHKRNKILARAHLQHRRHGVRMERQGRVYRHQRPIRAVHCHSVHRPAPAHHLADL